jgi:hypothetical protein
MSRFLVGLSSADVIARCGRRTVRSAHTLRQPSDASLLAQRPVSPETFGLSRAALGVASCLPRDAA